MVNVGDAEITVTADGRGLPKDVERAVRPLEAMLNRHAIRLGQKFGDRLAESRAGQRLKDSLERTFPSMRVMVVREGAILGRMFTRSVERNMQGLDKISARANRMLTVAMGAAPFVVSGLSAILAGVTALAGSVYMAATASASFIGILGSMGQAGIVAALAVGGLSEAYKGNAEALAKLTPEARAFVEQTKALAPAWQEMQRSVQGKVLDGLGDTFARLTDRLLPVLNTRLGEMGTQLNGLLKEVGKFVTSTQYVKDFDTALAGNNRTFEILRKAAIPLLNGITQLYIALQPAIERTAGAIVKGAEAFDRWATAGRESGSIAAFMDRAQNSASLLWGVLQNLVVALHNIFSASSTAGDGLLASLDRLTERFANWTGSVEGQNAIAKWAEQGATAFRKIGDIIVTLAPLFSEMAKPELFNALLTVLDSMAHTLQIIAPVINVVVSAFAKFLEVLAPILGPLLAIGLALKSLTLMASLAMWMAKVSMAGKVLGIALRIVGLALRGLLLAGPIGWIILLAGALVMLWQKSETFRNIVIGVWNAIKAAVAAVGAWFTGTLVPGLAAMWEVMKAQLAAVGQFFVDVWNGIKNGVMAVWNGLMAAAGLVWSAIKAVIMLHVNAAKFVIVTAFTVVKTVVLTIWNALKAATSLVWNAIKAVVSTAVNGVRSVVSSVFNAVKSVVTTVWNAIKNSTTAVWNAIKGVVSSVANAVKSVISSAFNAIKGIVTKAWSAAKGAVSSGISGVMGLVKGLPGKIKGALSDLGGLLVGAGKALIQGLANGIKAMASAPINAAKSVASGIKGLFGGSPVEYGPLLGWNRGGAGKNIMGFLTEGIVAGGRKSVAAMSAVASRIASAAAMKVGGPDSMFRVMGEQNPPRKPKPPPPPPEGGGGGGPLVDASGWTFNSGTTDPEAAAREVLNELIARLPA